MGAGWRQVCGGALPVLDENLSLQQVLARSCAGGGRALEGRGPPGTVPWAAATPESPLALVLPQPRLWGEEMHLKGGGQCWSFSGPLALQFTSQLTLISCLLRANSLPSPKGCCEHGESWRQQQQLSQPCGDGGPGCQET